MFYPRLIFLFVVQLLQVSGQKAFPEALALCKSTDTITYVSKTKELKGMLWTPVTDAKTVGFIYMPGGLVQPEAYSPTCFRLAEKGYPCNILRFPNNLAMFDTNQGQQVIKALPQVEKWIVLGHSMGGAYISNFFKFAKKQSWFHKIEGFALLDSFPASTMVKHEGKGLIIHHGTMEMPKVKKDVEKAIKLCPPQAKVYFIPGGNHAGFAYYKAKDNDSQMTITKDEQIDATISFVLDHFIINA